MDELLNRKQKTILNQLKIEGYIVKNPGIVAKEFKKHFCETRLKLAGTIPTNNRDPLKYVKPSSRQFSLKKTGKLS